MLCTDGSEDQDVWILEQPLMVETLPNLLDILRHRSPAEQVACCY